MVSVADRSYGVQMIFFKRYNSITNSMSTLREDRKLIPVKTYQNAETDKSRILLENKGKSGIYRWINKINKKTYVGSGKDLAKRLAIYYKTSELLKYKRPIHQALLKYGYENFHLEIIEYCTSDKLIKREQKFYRFVGTRIQYIKDCLFFGRI